MSTDTKQSFLSFIQDITEKTWKEKQQPFLLSKIIPSYIQETGDNEFTLKKITQEPSLKSFLEKEIKDGNIQVKIYIPKILAKISIIPKDADPIEIEPKNTKEIVINFLTIMETHLTDSERKEIIIPTYILSKFLKND